MKIAQHLITKNQGLICDKNERVQLVLSFGSKELIGDSHTFDAINAAYPNAYRLFCSTAGEIFDNKVLDDSISLVAIEFEHSQIKANCNNIADFANSYEAGKNLVSKFELAGLKFVFVISDGSVVNGSELVRGMSEIIPKHIPITGGLAGDGTAFNSTLVSVNMPPESGKMVAVAFYGDRLKISHSSMGGWESFGLERTVTKSEANVLYEIDGKNALDLYKTYLGAYAAELPSSALLFPLSVKNEDGSSVVRTILSVNHEENSMLFAGDIPIGAKVSFMKANFDRLIDAASEAAQLSLDNFQDIHPQLAILISCVGRKIILSDRIDEEVDAVKDVMKENTILTGFYSYGEISPLQAGTSCKLHNQTMTITCLEEF